MRYDKTSDENVDAEKGKGLMLHSSKKRNANKNYVLLCGDGLPQVRTKKFLEAAQRDALSFGDMREESLVVSEASKRMIIGCGDLHGAGFSCLGTTHSACCGEFLQAFQCDFGWK